MLRILTLAMIGALLAGCETTSQGTQDVDIKRLPAYKAHSRCTLAQILRYRRSTHPVEAGKAGSAACSHTRHALNEALVKTKGPAFARRHTAESERTDPKVIGAMIVLLSK